MGYVPVAASEPGTTIEVDVRGKLRSAEVREKPLYERPAPENEGDHG
jgi:glycine cleavage system aminomethyltransferase T